MYRDPGYKGYRLRDSGSAGKSVLADMYEDAYDAEANLQCALRLMEEAAGGQACVNYARLLGAARGGDRGLISGIMDDDKKHEEIIRRIYNEITNETLPEPKHAKEGKPVSYRRTLKAAFMLEQQSIAKYRGILFAMRTRRHINMMTEILTDKLRHLALYNYLLVKNFSGA